jgi:hypothetical protein
MSRFLQGKITYANVVATLALVLAMSGGALAASHYLINSTKQINPKVLKKLRGARGKSGPAGPRGISIQGPTGERGLKGEKGALGGRGSDGANGTSGYEPLPAGRSVSGEYAVRSEDAAEGASLQEAISLPMGLSSAIPAGHVLYSSIAAPASEHCSGPGHADRGYLCIYSAGSTGLGAPTPSDPEVSPVVTGGTGEHGFVLSWAVTVAATKEAPVFDVGTYTVTAP